MSNVLPPHESIQLRHCLSLGAGLTENFVVLGALIPLAQNGFISDIDGYIGSGTSCIISLLLSLGYTVQNIIAIATTTKLFHTYLPEDLGPMLIANLGQRYGFFDNKRRASTLMKAVVDKLGCVPTFKEHYMATGKFLCFPARCVEKQETVFFTHLTTPDVSVVDGVLAATNLPVIMEMFKLDEWTYIDGSLKSADLNTAPFQLQINKLTSIVFESSDRIPNVSPNEGIPFGYILNVIRTLLDKRELILPPSDDKLEIRIEINSFDDFGCSLVYGPGQEALHLHQGYVACDNYLKRIKGQRTAGE